jgi:hypothetical protein
MSQVLTTSTGQSYSVMVGVAGDIQVSATSTLGIDWGGNQIGSFTTGPVSYDGTKQYVPQLQSTVFTTTVVANSSSEVLGLQTLNGTALWVEWVQVVPLPEPSILLLAVSSAVFLAGRTSWKCERGNSR